MNVEITQDDGTSADKTKAFAMAACAMLSQLAKCLPDEYCLTLLCRNTSDIEASLAITREAGKDIELVVQAIRKTIPVAPSISILTSEPKLSANPNN